MRPRRPSPATTPHKYCVSCHTQALKERGTVPVALDSGPVECGRQPEVWKGRAEASRRPHAAAGAPGRTSPRMTLARGSKRSWIRDPLPTSIREDRAVSPSQSQRNTESGTRPLGLDGRWRRCCGRRRELRLRQHRRRVSDFADAVEHISVRAEGQQPGDRHSLAPPNIDSSGCRRSLQDVISQVFPTARAAERASPIPSRWMPIRVRVRCSDLNERPVVHRGAAGRGERGR